MFVTGSVASCKLFRYELFFEGRVFCETYYFLRTLGRDRLE